MNLISDDESDRVMFLNQFARRGNFRESREESQRRSNVAEARRQCKRDRTNTPVRKCFNADRRDEEWEPWPCTYDADRDDR